MLPTNQEEKVIHHVQERYANVQSKIKIASYDLLIYLEKVQPNSAQLILN